MSATTEVILEIGGLTKAFKGFVAVNDVNLKLRRGSIHALIGLNGAGGVEPIKMAIADMEKQLPGEKIELLTADHQNKADVASSRGREWFDQQGMDILIDGMGSIMGAILTGLIFVLCVMAFRRGIVGETAAWWPRRSAAAG
jgi:ATPase subunit of ABC transporter with duplicated ATPase domains